ncbi:MAG: RHS repeat-associated core domain-containing protein, partial [Bacteroidota bacterium]
INRASFYGGLMDDLSYYYQPNTNRLDWVQDAQFITPINETGVKANQNNNNYTYDGSGNLIEDVSENTTIDWNVYGKIDTVRNDSVWTYYGYDVDQSRVMKKELDPATGDMEKTTFYVKGASGEVLAIYKKVPGETTIVGGVPLDGPPKVSWEEQYLYGSERLGVLRPSTNVNDPTEPYFIKEAKVYQGLKNYEFTNHLGNVMTVINDRKEAIDDNADEIADAYHPVRLSAQDYYPFGLEMPQRGYAVSDEYRYGYNGKEAEHNEEFGSVTNYDYGARIYNPGIARFLSIDPLMATFPQWSPYNYAANSPVALIDREGMIPVGESGGESASGQAGDEYSGQKRVGNVTMLYNESGRRIFKSARSEDRWREILSSKMTSYTRYFNGSKREAEADLSVGIQFGFDILDIVGVDVNLGSLSLLKYNSADGWDTDFKGEDRKVERSIGFSVATFGGSIGTDRQFSETKGSSTLFWLTEETIVNAKGEESTVQFTELEAGGGLILSFKAKEKIIWQTKTEFTLTENQINQAIEHLKK